MIAADTALPTSDQLDLFLDRLRLAQFKIGPDEIAGAQKILLLAHAEAADDGLAARRLKTMLAPIVARTPTQQADFYRRFDDLVAGIVRAPAAGERGRAAPTMDEPAAVSGPASTGGRARAAVIATVATGVLLLAIAGGVWLFWRPPPPPPPPPSEKSSPTIADVTGWIVPPPSFTTATLSRRPGYQAALAGLIVLPPLLFAGWMLWRWRRRVLWLERHPGVREADPAVLRLPQPD